MMRALSAFAIGLIIVGMVAMAGPTFGASTIAGDRSVSIHTADDQSEAYLGIVPEEDIGELAGNDDAREIATLINNAGTSADVEVEIDSIPDADDEILTVDTVHSSLDPEAATEAEVRCAVGQDVGERDVNFRASTSESPITVSDAVFTVTIDIQCNKGSGSIEPPTEIISESISGLEIGANDQSQEIEFELTEALPEGEEVIITLDGVSTGSNFDYSGTTVTQTTNTPGEVSGAESGRDYEVRFEANSFIPEGESITIEIDGIDSENNPDGEYDGVFERTDMDGSETVGFVAE